MDALRDMDVYNEPGACDRYCARRAQLQGVRDDETTAR